MRYYGVNMNTDIEEINANSTVKLRDYSWGDSYQGFNAFFSQTLMNDVTFMVYRAEDDGVYAQFSYDETKYSYEDVHDHIFGTLNEKFKVQKFNKNPKEISMWDFMDNMNEGRRRDYINNWNRLADIAGLWVFDHFGFYASQRQREMPFDFSEMIISTNCDIEDGLYDKSLLGELDNIETHKNESGLDVNMVHYAISSRSTEATKDMMRVLMNRLYDANRISTRRVDIVSNVKPQMRDSLFFFDLIVENNYGGVVVFDLSEKFGYDSVEYGGIAKYIAGLVKKHRNKCLFVFTYNIDNPGFAYDILSQVQDFVITMPLKEGTGDRKTAIKYLQSLIKDSQYAEYANQAEEFMEQYVSDKFTQTDVLMAFEKFEPWCVNKNIMKAYDNVFSKEFMLDRDENALSAYDRLQKLVGLEHVKCRIDDIIKAHSIEVVRKKLLGNNYQAGTMHMIMSGNPGTGKTEVARLLAGIAKEKDILKSGAFVATSGPALNGGDIKDEVPNAFKAATDGVLFIDEAYAMLPSTATILIQELEEHRDDVIVILAGYEESMKGFLDLNDGIKSRIPHWIEFPDYTLEELVDIFKMMADSRRFSYDDAVINEVRSVLDKERFIENFGNARAVRNLLDDVIKKQSVRLAEQKDDSDDIDKTKLWTITVEDITTLDEYKAQKKSDKTAREQLEELIGQEKVKEVIYKAIANIKMKKEKLDRGIRVDNASYHMVFTGNPGVAKTTIARLLAEILKDENVLPTGNFVEAGRADLVAAVVGATAPKVKQRFKEARGGVLFIDEAYALCDSHNNSFGDEAIATIVQEMENHREDTIVVFAGYTEQMKDFLDRNPGMASRIAFNIEFDDYTTDELCDITRLILSNRDMNITDEAMEKLRDNYEVARKSNDYGNGRYVRKMLEEAEMNISTRLYKEPARITDELLTTIEVEDIPEIDFNKMNRSATVGFSTI